MCVFSHSRLNECLHQSAWLGSAAATTSTGTHQHILRLRVSCQLASKLHFSCIGTRAIPWQGKVTCRVKALAMF